MAIFTIFVLLYAYIVLFSRSSGHVLHSVSGEVSGGNFSYYSLMYKGPITLYLISTRGDSDIYISQYLTKPSFEPENYCLQSSTCGLDIIDIPKSFIRPVGIAIYGHPFHDLSEYYLEVVYRNDILVLEEEEDYFEDQQINKEVEEERLNSSEGKQSESEGEEGSFLSALFWTFLNILVEVLFL